MTRELSLADIFQIGYYWETKILLTAVKLDLFSALRGQSLSVNDVAGALALNPRALELVMNALVAMRVLTKDEKLYANTSGTTSCPIQSRLCRPFITLA